MKHTPNINDKIISYSTYGGVGSIGAFLLDSADLMQAIGIWLMVLGLAARLIYDTVRFFERKKK